MFDSFANLLFVFVALAIFIVRTVVEARKKKAPPPRVPPVHFEDGKKAPASGNKRIEEGEYSPYLSRGASEYSKGMTTQSTTKARKKQSQPLAARAVKDTDLLSVTADKTSPAKGITPPVSPERRIGLNLNHLSPMKQAVVMAEVLGPPKRIQMDFFNP